MIEVELQIPANASSEDMVRIVELVCVSHGLTCVRKGTLEITWWETKIGSGLKWQKVEQGIG